MLVLILVVASPLGSISAQDNPYLSSSSSQLPSDITYNEINSMSEYVSPELRVGADDEPELGGIDEPDPTIPVGDGVYPLLAAILGYIVYYRRKKTKMQHNTIE